MSLRAKLLLALVVLTVLPLAVVSWMGMRYVRSDKEAFVTLLGGEVTPVVADEVDANVARLVDRLKLVAGLSASLGADAPRAAAAALRGSGIGAVKIFERGRETASFADDAALPEDPAGRRVLDGLVLPKAPLDPGAVRIDNVTRSASEPLARITLRTDDPNEEILVAAIVPTSRILRPSAASTFDTWLVDAGGRVLSHPDAEVVAARKDVSATTPVRKIREGLTGSEPYESLGGEEVLGSYAPAKRGGLGVVQELPADAVYGAVRALVRNVAIALAAVLLVSLLVAVVVARGVARPVGELARVAREIGGGRFDVDVPATPGGEVGELSDALRSMQRGLAERDARLKEAQDALIQSEKMGALGQLAAGITHEVKNPMAGIIGFAQLCQKIAPEGSPLVPHLQMIEKESKRAKEILENLLRFARREEVEMDLVAPNTIVVETTRLVAHQLQLAKVQLSTRTAEDLPLVMGNINQLQQVLMNLMMNAMHAMQPKGGRLEVATSLAKNGMVVIEVKDEGHGIKAEHRSRLFTPFFTTKPGGQGTGLGLSVSYGIVQQHQGEIKVWSQEGVGTIFYVYLPRARDFRREAGAAA